MVASSTAMRWKNADLRSKITPSRGVCPRFLAISPLLPLQKSAIITRQSSIRRSRWARSCLRLLPPLQKSPIITRQSSIHSSRRAFLPYALLLPLQKSTIITRQSSIHSSRWARSCHTLCFFPFKNHQSSLDNHQSVPRDGRGLEEKLRDCPRVSAMCRPPGLWGWGVSPKSGGLRTPAGKCRPPG